MTKIGKSQKTTSNRVYLDLRERILAGEYAVSEKLPETEIGERMNVSRTPVREALQRLANEGFVDLRPHAGASVRAWTQKDVRETFEVRATLESMGARLAAERARPDDIKCLERIRLELENGWENSPDGWTRASELNTAFHLTIMRMSGNDRLASLAENLIAIGFTARSYSSFSHDHLMRSFMDHERLVMALANGDGQWAHSIMHGHILAGASSFVGTSSM